MNRDISIPYEYAVASADLTRIYTIEVHVTCPLCHLNTQTASWVASYGISIWEDRRWQE